MKYEDIRIRKVECLGDRASKMVVDMGLKADELVIVRTYADSRPHHLPTYSLEKIEGSPIDYLLSKIREQEVKEQTPKDEGVED